MGRSIIFMGLVAGSLVGFEQMATAAPPLERSISEARAFEASLAGDPARLKFRHNLERLIDLWSTARAKTRGANRTVALEGEARAWVLLAHWSGRASDRDKAQALTKQLDRARGSDVAPSSPSPNGIGLGGALDAARQHAQRQPGAERAPSPARISKMTLEERDGGSSLDLVLHTSGAFVAERTAIPPGENRAGRVVFDLTPMIALDGVAGTMIPIGREGFLRARIGQFDRDTVRLVLDLEKDGGSVPPLEIVADARAKPRIVLATASSASLSEIVKDVRRAFPDVQSNVGRDTMVEPPLRPDVDEDVVVIRSDALPSTAVGAEPSAGPEGDVSAAGPTSSSTGEVASAGVTSKADLRALGSGEGSSEAPPVRERGDRGAAFLKIRRVVIDAGHGGKDHGAVAGPRVREKDVNLAIALKLGEELERRLGVEVVYTRRTDQFVSLRRRSQVANGSDADLFVSIHANAHRKRSVNGIETYFLNTTSDRYAEKLARRENTGETATLEAEDDPEPGVGMPEPDERELPGGTLGRDLRLMLADLAMRSATAESRRLAGYVQGALVGTLKREHADVRDLGVKHALFFVLLGARMPSVLIETGFVTNPIEGRRLKSSEYQADVAAAIAQGIVRFANERAEVARMQGKETALAAAR